MAVAEWLRHKVLSLVQTLVSFFPTIFTTAVTVLLEYLDHEFTMGSYILLYNSVNFYLIHLWFGRGSLG